MFLYFHSRSKKKYKLESQDTIATIFYITCSKITTFKKSSLWKSHQEVSVSAKSYAITMMFLLFFLAYIVKFVQLFSLSSCLYFKISIDLFCYCICDQLSPMKTNKCNELCSMLSNVFTLDTCLDMGVLVLALSPHSKKVPGSHLVFK